MVHEGGLHGLVGLGGYWVRMIFGDEIIELFGI